MGSGDGQGEGWLITYSSFEVRTLTPGSSKTMALHPGRVAREGIDLDTGEELRGIIHAGAQGGRVTWLPGQNSLGARGGGAQTVRGM